MAVVLTPKLIKIHILPDISRSKDLLMEYNMRNVFLENSCDNEEGGDQFSPTGNIRGI